MRVPDSEVEIVCQGRRDISFHHSITEDLALDLCEARADAKEQHEALSRIWNALGITTYEGAEGKEISELVAELRAQVAQLQEIVDKVRILADKHPPDTWEPYDDAPFALDVNSSDGGDLHSHGVAVGAWEVTRLLRSILREPPQR